MAQPKLSINIPSSPSRRLSDITLSPVRVYDVEQLRLLPPELDAKAHSDPVLAQYLYFTVVAGPDEQAVFEEQTRLWTLKTLSLPESFEDTSRLSFAKRLRNGVIACRVLHLLWPQLRSESLASPSGKPSLHTQTDSSRRNLETFLDGCESLGVPVATAHSTRDQLRHDILSYTSTRAIIFCLLELSRLATAQGLATPPPIIAFEAAIDAGDRSDPFDSARSVLDQIEGSAPSRTSSPSSSSGSESEHGRAQRAVSVASSTAASALSRSESEPSTAEGPASSREHRPSRGRRSSSISVQIVSESDALSSGRAVSMSIEVGEASGAPSLFANFEAHSTTPLSRQQPEIRRSKWRSIATAPEAAQQAEVVLVAVSSDASSSSAAAPSVSPPTPSAAPPTVNVEVTPTAQAPRNRFFFAELSPRSSLANRLSGGAYARSKWRSIAVHTEHATTPLSQQPAQHPGAEAPNLHPQATPVSPSTAKAPVASGKQEASFNSPEGSKPTKTEPQEPSTESSPITFLHDYLPVSGDVIDEAVAACFLRNKLRIRPVRLSKGNYLFSSVNRVLRSPRNQAEALSPRLKRASRVFSFGDGPIDPSMLSAFPFPVTPVSNGTNSAAAAATAPPTGPDAGHNVPSSPSVSMSLSLSGSDTDGPITVEAPVRLISNALLVRYDGLWMDLRAFVSHFVAHVNATRKSRMLASLNSAIDTPLTLSPIAVRASGSLDGILDEAAEMDEDAGVCETDVIVLEDQLRECFLDTMLPKLAHFDVSKIGQFSSELLFRKAIAEGVSCDRYDEFIEEELGRLTRHRSSRKHGYDAQPSPAPHGVKRPHANPSAVTESSDPRSGAPPFPGRTQHSEIRQFVKRLLRR